MGPWFTDTTVYPRDIWQEYGPYRIRHPNINANAMSLESYEENSQWILESANFIYGQRYAVHNVAKYYDTVEFTLRMKRRPEFFIYSLILPCFILTR